MSKNKQYPILQERILQGQNKGYFFISADKSKIIYKASAKTYDFESEKEKQPSVIRNRAGRNF